MTAAAVRCLFLPDCLGNLNDNLLDINIKNKIVGVAQDTGVVDAQHTIDY